MNILVIGGGGREHAIIKKLRENPTVKQIYALPGNGGIVNEAQCFPIAATDLDGIMEFASNKQIDFAVVAPDDPLVMGAVDRLESLGIPTFGPNSHAAVIEGSKVYAKELMKKYDIPTADYQVFTTAEQALEFIKKNQRFPLVIKADGLALGKGVIIAEDLQQAIDAITSIMIDRKFGNSGKQVVIEEYLTGPEITVLAFTDSHSLVPMISSMDHKKALEGDKGLNTGGMGCIAPNPYYTPEVEALCMEKIFIPTIKALRAENRPFKGCLYFGLMLTKDGPKVIEYNCRFGDPEAQVVLPLLDTDLLIIMQAVQEERLDQIDICFKNAAACCVVAASAGYPAQYKTGFPISELCKLEKEDIYIYHAGTRKEGNKILTSGGRVLGITALAPDLKQAIEKSYDTIRNIDFQGIYYRKDIGKQALIINIDEVDDR